MPNSFYRFQPAWNAGFYPDNQITSNLLNALHGNVSAWLPGFYPGTTVSQLVQGVRVQMDIFNVSPYFGNLEIVFTTAPDPPFVEYYIYVRNKSLYAVDNTQDFLVSGLYNPTTNLVINATISPFTVGSYSGTFDPSTIAVESEVDRALQIVEQNGSAFFPLTYSYNTTSGIATSGLARGKNWQLDSSGNPVRLPADTLPKQNARTFNVAAQTAEDRYCISLMEKVINYSLTETDETLIQAYFNTFTVPDGWTASFAISIDTYTRVFCLMYRDDRSLLMIGRLDTTWLWQRFINEAGSSDFSYFSGYTSTTPLPYLPTISYQWLYGDWYDMEFVNFTDSCYVSPEFYAMPAIPGDNWQLNVPSDSGNLTGLNSALVGLFTQDGQFVQQIGDGVKPTTDCDCVPCSLVMTYTLDSAEWDAYLIDVSQLNELEATNLNFAIYKNNVQIEFGGQSFVNPPDSYTFTNIQDAGLSISPPVVLTESGGVYTFSCIIADAICGDVYRFENQISDATVFPTTWITIFASDSFECPNVANTTNQLNASCIIPAVKNGCYRLGLYDEPTTTCDLTFEYSLTGEEYTNWIDTINAQFSSISPYISFYINGGALITYYVYTIPSSSNTALEISNWVNVNIPGMTSTYDEFGIYFSWIVNDVLCNDSYAMFNCLSLEEGSCLATLWQTDSQNCLCGDSFYLYSLSNIINIDTADCFSTMIEFWANDNSIAQGFEYFNGWKQRIRIGLNGGGEKPKIEESIYRQSNGVSRRPSNKQDLSIDLHTDFFDLETQLAMTDATRHPYLVWNGQNIFVTGDIEVATIQDFTTQSSFETLSQMKFQALKQGFQPKNSSCLTC
jgi:hypothetical protein